MNKQHQVCKYLFLLTICILAFSLLLPGCGSSGEKEKTVEIPGAEETVVTYEEEEVTPEETAPTITPTPEPTIVPIQTSTTIPIESLPANSIILPVGYDVSAVYTAPLAAPWDMIFTPSGDLLVTEQGLPRIRKVSPNGDVDTFAILPASCYAIAYNAEGELFTGGAGQILRIKANGHPVAFAKADVSKMVLGPDGAFYAIDWAGSPDVNKIAPDGNVKAYATGLSHASDLAFSPSGELYVADPGSRRIVKVNTDGTLATVATGFWTEPGAIAFNKTGHLFYWGWWGSDEDWMGMGIYKVSVSDGSVTPFVLGFYRGAVHDLEIDDSGNIYGVGPTLGVLFKVSPQGEVEFLIEGWYNTPGLAVAPSGDLFVADQGSLSPLVPGKIVRIDTDGRHSVFFDGLISPQSLAFDPSGNLFVADQNRVLQTTSGGDMHVVSENLELRSIAFDRVSGSLFGFQSFPFQDRPARLLRITPEGDISPFPVVFEEDIWEGRLAIDSGGNVLLAVTYMENINVGPLFTDLLRISPGGEVKVLASFVGNVPATHCIPVTGPTGEIYVLDQPGSLGPSNFVIWKVTPQGEVSLFTNRMPSDPFSIAVNSEGDIFFTSGVGIYKIFMMEEGIVSDGLKKEWQGFSPIAKDPKDDWKELEIDIESLYGFTDGENMFLMAEFYQLSKEALDSLNAEIDFDGDGSPEYTCIFLPNMATVLVLNMSEPSLQWRRRGFLNIVDVAEMKMPLSYIGDQENFYVSIVAIGEIKGKHQPIDRTEWVRITQR